MKEVKVDLKVARREAGLSQHDLAHLLSTSQPRISKLEHGKSILTVREMCKLAVIFNKSTTQMFRLLTRRIEEQIALELKAMPGASKGAIVEVRSRTLDRLKQRLSVVTQRSHAG